MDYGIGDLVVYVPVGVCRVQGCEDKCLDGRNHRQYIVLVPETGARTVCYLPVDMAEQKLRALRSEDEVNSIIDRIPAIEPCEAAPRGDRRTMFSDILKSDDALKIISLVKLLLTHRDQREQVGKHLAAGEEAALKTALSIVSQEFAIVLGISEDEAEQRICDKLSA
ncbi:MAG: hypothetical protein IJ746_05605 [Ruminococcus sp.]|nr:hypothetical protein [Ruminococcus sp.]